MLANWIRHTTTTTTTGPGPLTVVSVAGYPGYYETIGVNRRAPYCILDSTGAPVEEGIGYLSDATTWVREKITATYANSALFTVNPSAVTLPAGTYQLICPVSAIGVLGAAKGFNRAVTGASLQKLFFSQHMAVHNASSNGIALAPNRLTVVPCWLTASLEGDALGVRIGTGVTGTSVRMGLWDLGSDQHPAKLLGETAPLASATSGVDLIGTIAAVQRLHPGWYALGIVSNGAPTVGMMTTGGQSQSFLGSSGANMLLAQGSFVVDWTFGPLPNGNVPTAITSQAASSATPAIGIRST